MNERFELIDTLWNVNSFNNTLLNNFMLELIDTLWNVNTTETFSIPAVTEN